MRIKSINLMGLAPTLVLMTLLAGTSPTQAILVKSFDFNTANDTEGWSAVRDIADLQQNTAVSPGGDVGVLTASEITGPDPALQVDTTLNLPIAGFIRWDQISYRIRQLDVSGQPIDLDSTGIKLTIQSSDLNVVNGPQTNVSDGANGWRRITTDISSAGTEPLVNLQIKPMDGVASVGNSFEIDYVRVTAIPAPSTSSTLLALMGGCLVLIRGRQPNLGCI